MSTNDFVIFTLQVCVLVACMWWFYKAGAKHQKESTLYRTHNFYTNHLLDLLNLIEKLYKIDTPLAQGVAEILESEYDRALKHFEYEFGPSNLTPFKEKTHV